MPSAKPDRKASTSSPTGMLQPLLVQLDGDGVVLAISAGVCELLGCDEVMAIGKSWLNLVGSEQHGNTLGSCRAGNDLSSISPCGDIFVEAISNRNGSERQIQWQYSSILDPFGILVSGVDVTQQRLLESMNQRYARQLKRLLPAQLLSNLTGGIAHNFNNIIASIIGYTELSQEILKASKNESVDDFLGNVHSSATDAKKFVNTVFLISSGAETEIKEPVLTSMLEPLQKLLRSVFSRNINFILDIDESLPIVMLYPDTIRQMAMQLCVNSREAMGNNGDITLGLHSLKAYKGICSSCGKAFEGDFLEFSVRDTGKGISAEKLASVFSKQAQQDEVNDGLGLAMVHDSLHELGGHLVANLEAEKGAHFRCLIPVETTGRG